MLKKLLVLMIAAALLLTMAACTDTSGRNPSSNPGSDTADEFEPTSKTIRVAFNGGWWEDDAKYNFVFDDFKAKYPEYTVERMENITSTEDLLASIQAGNPPDFWLSNDGNSAGYPSTTYGGYLQSLSNYLEKDTDVNLSNMDENLMSMLKFLDGNYYGLPYKTSHLCLVYNKKIFEQNGLDKNNPPSTWDEMYETAKKLVVTDSAGKATQIGFSVNGTEGPYAYQMLPTLKKSDLDEYGLWSRHSEKYVQDVMEYCSKFSDLIDNKLPSEVNFSFAEGNTGMAIASLSQLTTFTSANIDFGIAPLPIAPGMDESVIYSYIWQYVGIPTGAKNPNGGWLFCKYVVTDVLQSLTKIDLTEHPKSAVPDYIAHKPTMEKIDTLYASTLNATTKAIYDQRNKIMEESALYTAPGTPIHPTLQTLSEEMDLKRRREGLSYSDYLKELGTKYDAELKIWIETMKAQGWQFPEGAAPIPPSK